MENVTKLKLEKLKKTTEEQLDKDGDNLFNWFFVVTNKKLSESFIEKHLTKLKLHLVLEYQVVSETFIAKHIDKLDDELWEIIFNCQELSEEFKEKHGKKKN